MESRRALLSDKTSSSPFFAAHVTFRRIPRYTAFDFFDIVAVVGGRGSQTFYDRSGDPHTRPLHPGCMALYRPDDELMLTGFAPHGISVMYVSFPATEWAAFASLIGLDPAWVTDVEPPVVTFDPADPRIPAIFDRAIDHYRGAEPNALDLVQFWVDIIPTMFPGAHPQIPGLGAPLWLTRSLGEMRQEHNLRAGLPRLLELARVTGPHLSSTVRRYFGRTPTLVILRMRLRHAATLLETSPDAIGIIAQRCGFRSFAYFSTAFREHFGVSPSEYRRRSRTRFAGAGVPREEAGVGENETLNR